MKTIGLFLHCSTLLTMAWIPAYGTPEISFDHPPHPLHGGLALFSETQSLGSDPYQPCNFSPASFSPPNQTSELTCFTPEYDVPFRVQVEDAGFQIGSGIHSYSSAEYDGKWLFIGGRTNGMHGFNNDDFNFPPQKQNTVVYVVDPTTQTVYSRDLTDDPNLPLSSPILASLAVTSPEFYQPNPNSTLPNSTLYVTGGYGADDLSNVVNPTFSTKNLLTAIDIPGLMNWVVNEPVGDNAVDHIRQISDATVQVTGGYLSQINNGPMLLVFGQNFQGAYLDPTANGNYTEQVTTFTLNDDGTSLSISDVNSLPSDPNYRRRDLNVVPVIRNINGQMTQELVALSGVFTLETGVWTVPVEIQADGTSFMADPNSPDSFKQGLNNYASANLGLYSESAGQMYTLLLGGLSTGYWSQGTFTPDSEIPFDNTITTIGIDQDDNYTQYVMSGTYPSIPVEPPIQGAVDYYFGSAGQVMLPDGLPLYSDYVINLDALGTAPMTAGYIVGGIQSALPNTVTSNDSGASSYIFKVTIIPVPIISGCQTIYTANNNLDSLAGTVILDCGTIVTEASLDSPTNLSIRQGGGTFDTNGFNTMLSGVIWGAGPFSKTGAGALTLTGNSGSYSGNFTLNEGTLTLGSNGVLGGSLYITPGTLLNGTGTVNNLVNSGVVKPGNSPGTIIVTGDYVQIPGGTLAIDIDSTSNSLLQVTGNASLNSTLQTNLLGGFSPALGTSYQILTANQLSGSFSYLNTNITPTILFSPIYSPTDVSIVAVRDYLNQNLTQFLTPNEIAVGSMLNTISANPIAELLLNALDSLSTYGSVANAYDQLMANTAAIQSTLVFTEVSLQTNNIIRRMEVLRSGQRGCDCSGFKLENGEGSYACNRSSLDWLGSNVDSPWGLFLTGNVILENQNETLDRNHFDGVTAGVTLGLDYTFNECFIAGVMGGYSYAQADLKYLSNKIHDNQFSLGVYGTGQFCNFYLDVFAAYGWNDYKIDRTISFASIDEKAQAKPKGHYSSFYGDIGYELTVTDHLIVEPTLSFQQTFFHADAYNESGAGLLDLHVHKQFAKSLLGSAGFVFNYLFKTSCIEFMSNVNTFYVHEFEDRNRFVTSDLVNIPNSAFVIATGENGKDFARLGAGVSALIQDNFMIYLDYNAYVGREHFFAQSVNGGIRIQF